MTLTPPTVATGGTLSGGTLGTGAGSGTGSLATGAGTEEPLWSTAALAPEALVETEAALTLTGAGTDDYDALENRPRVNGVTLTGNKTAAQLGLTALALGAVEAKNTLTNEQIDELMEGV